MRALVAVVMLATASTASAQTTGDEHRQARIRQAQIQQAWDGISLLISAEIIDQYVLYPNAPAAAELSELRARYDAKDVAGLRQQVVAAIAKAPGLPVYRLLRLSIALLDCELADAKICPDILSRYHEYASATLDPSAPPAYADDWTKTRAIYEPGLRRDVATRLAVNVANTTDLVASEATANLAVELHPSFLPLLIRGILRNNLKNYSGAIADLERAQPLALTDATRARVARELATARGNAERTKNAYVARKGKPIRFHPGPIGALATYSLLTRPSVLRQIEADVERRGGSMEAPLAFAGGVGWHADNRGLEFGFAYMRVRGSEPLGMMDHAFTLRSWGFYGLGAYYLGSFGPLSIQIPVSITTSYQKSNFRAADTSGVAFLIAGGLRVSITAKIVTLFAEGTYGVDPFVYLAGGGLSNGGTRVMLEDGELDGGMGGPGLRLGVVLGAY